jgi:hypothetical protein
MSEASIPYWQPPCGYNDSEEEDEDQRGDDGGRYGPDEDPEDWEYDIGPDLYWYHGEKSEKAKQLSRCEAFP